VHSRSDDGTTIEKLEAYKRRVAREKREREEAKKRLKLEREKEKAEKKKWREENEKKRQKRLLIDKKDNKLIDVAAIKYWGKHFNEEKIVTNAEFAAKLKPYLLQKKWNFDNNPKRLLFEGTDEERKRKVDEFIDMCLTRFFLLPNPENFPQCQPSLNFVSQDTVQYCIHIFGPWIQIFEMIKVQFYDLDDRTLPRPIEVWHGRITKEKAEELLKKGDEKKSSRKQRYLLRLGTAENEEGKIYMSNIRRSRRGDIIMAHERLERKMPGKIHIVNWNKRRTGKTKPIPPKWTYIETLPSAGGMRDNYTHYTNMTNFLISMKGHNTVDTRNKCAGPARIRTPVYPVGFNYGPEVKDGELSSDVDSPEVYKEPNYVDDDGDATPEDQLDKFTDDEGVPNEKKEATQES